MNEHNFEKQREEAGSSMQKKDNKGKGKKRDHSKQI